jgi:hypothetical protein
MAEDNALADGCGLVGGREDWTRLAVVVAELRWLVQAQERDPRRDVKLSVIEGKLLALHLPHLFAFSEEPVPVASNERRANVNTKAITALLQMASTPAPIRKAVPQRANLIAADGRAGLGCEST